MEAKTESMQNTEASISYMPGFASSDCWVSLLLEETLEEKNTMKQIRVVIPSEIIATLSL